MINPPKTYKEACALIAAQLQKTTTSFQMAIGRETQLREALEDIARHGEGRGQQIAKQAIAEHDKAVAAFGRFHDKGKP